MTSQESTLIMDALEEVKSLLERKMLKGYARHSAMVARAKLEAALNWGDDETPAVDD